MGTYDLIDVTDIIDHDGQMVRVWNVDGDETRVHVGTETQAATIVAAVHASLRTFDGFQ